MPKCFTRAPAFVTAWIVLCASCNCIGWILSALHQLNSFGYAIAFGFVLGALVIWRKPIFADHLRPFSLARFGHRFSRFFPLSFLLLASLAILGGVLHAPSNYDGLAYRLPRIMNWLSENQWHWIHTDFQRLNTRTCGVEWLSAPLIAFTRGDRLLFGINAMSFLLLPGLIFSLFTRIGIKARVAWHWMWLAPSGYCFILQAGSIANDMFSAVFALAALDYALRARKSGRAFEASLSVVSAALMTAAKASNLPLLLPWLVAFAPVCRQWIAKPVAAGLAIICVAGASLVPTAILNYRYSGDWTGAKAEALGIGQGPVWVHLLNNSVGYSLSNLTPPVFPLAGAWNRFADRLIPEKLAVEFQRYFEPGAAHWRLDELQIEEGAGLGFGVTLLLVVSLIAIAAKRKRVSTPASRWRANPDVWVLCLAPWISLLYLMTKLGLTGAGRYLAPYYLLLMMGPLRCVGHESLIQRKWWRASASVVFALAALLLVISPARPLWPATWFCARYRAELLKSPLGERALNVYETVGARPRAFQPALNILPQGITVMGLVTADDPEASLWWPFGARRVRHVRAGDARAEVLGRGIRYVLVKEELLKEPWQHWLRRMDGRLVASVDLKLRAGQAPLAWRLVELN